MDKKVEFYSEGTPVAGIIGFPEDYQAGEQRAAVILVSNAQRSFSVTASPPSRKSFSWTMPSGCKPTAISR